MKSWTFRSGGSVAALPLLLVGLHVDTFPGTAQRPFDAAEMVAQWIAAVERHQPGERDATITWLGALSPDGWKTLNEGLRRYLAKAASGDGGSTDLIRRAAVFHTDAAMLGDAAPVSIAGVGWSTNSPSRLISTADSRYVGEAVANWNWVFARFLIDLFGRSSGRHPFVALWYHATTAYLLRDGLFGEARAHLDAGVAAAPSDANLRFDRACLFETLGLPRSQLVLEDWRVRNVLNPSSGSPRQPFVPGQPPHIGAPPAIPAARDANAEAERGFRRALDLAPALVEARVRLGRLLELRGRAREATIALDAALREPETQRDPMVLYYAHLFAARAKRAAGQIDDAVAHLSQALALFPHAQSALVASSALAILKGDLAGALTPISHLSDLTGEQLLQTDPWWSYHLGAGRDADRLLRDMWTQSTRR